MELKQNPQDVEPDWGMKTIKKTYKYNMQRSNSDCSFLDAVSSDFSVASYTDTSARFVGGFNPLWVLQPPQVLIDHPLV